jgi:hypothetical protein
MNATATAPLTGTMIAQFDLNTRLFKNVTADVSDEHARTRPNANTNHIAWIVGHTLSSRYMLANVLGVPDAEPFPDLYAKGKGLVVDATYPTLKELAREWPSISQKMIGRIRELTDAEMQADAPFPVPNGKRIIDFITFIGHHEAYMIGQLGILRRFFGYEAMKYN